MSRSDGLLSLAGPLLQDSGRATMCPFLVLRTLILRVSRLMTTLRLVRLGLVVHWRWFRMATPLHPLVPTSAYAIMLNGPVGRGSSVPWLLLNRLARSLFPSQRLPLFSLR